MPDESLYQFFIISAGELRRDEWFVKILDRRSNFHCRTIRKSTAEEPPFDDMIDEALTFMSTERRHWMNGKGTDDV